MSDTKLSPFDGRPVVATTVAITGAGDGLSKAMKVDPQELHHSETVYVVLECEVAKVRFDRVDEDADDLIRVHMLKAGVATIVPKDLVNDALLEQRRKLDEAKGIQQLPGMDGDDTGDDEATGDELADLKNRKNRKGTASE